MAAGDLIKLVVNQTMNSEVVQNVLYYEVISDDTSTSNEQAVADEFDNSPMLSTWEPLVVDEISFDCLSTQKVFPTPIGAVLDTNIGRAGQKTSEGLPATDAALLQKFNPAVGGKGKKGRMYIAGLPKLDENLGRIENVPFAAWKLLAAQMALNLTSPGGGDYKPAWAIRNPATPFEITGFVTDLTWVMLPRIATQRRRRTPVRASS